jgi:hypothetical protein
MTAENGGIAGQSSLQTLQGAANSEESGNFPPRKLLLVRTLGLPIAFAARDRKGTGAGQSELFRARQGDQESTCAH